MKILYLLIKHTEKRSNFWAIVDCSGNDYIFKPYVYVWGKVGNANRHIVKLSGNISIRRLKRSKYRNQYYDLSERDSNYNLIQNDIKKYLTIQTLSGKIK